MPLPVKDAVCAALRLAVRDRVGEAVAVPECEELPDDVVVTESVGLAVRVGADGVCETLRDADAVLVGVWVGTKDREMESEWERLAVDDRVRVVEGEPVGQGGGYGIGPGRTGMRPENSVAGLEEGRGVHGMRERKQCGSEEGAHIGPSDRSARVCGSPTFPVPKRPRGAIASLQWIVQSRGEPR